jgi:hypothetical protein
MDDGELTKTGKIRRKFVREKYQNLYDALYDESVSEKEVEAFFQYQDGQTTTVKTRFLFTPWKGSDELFFSTCGQRHRGGSIYALAALGFVLIYKSSKVLNIAHGQIIAAGAFIAYALTGWAGIPIYISFLLSMVITFFLAMSVERIFLRRLIGEPIISVIMVTIGLMSILDGYHFFTPFGSVNFSFPRFLPQTLISFGGVSISWTQLVGVIVTAVMIGGSPGFSKNPQWASPCGPYRMTSLPPCPWAFRCPGCSGSPGPPQG